MGYILLFNIFIYACLFLNTYSTSAQTTIPTPESHFGFKPGDDKQLFLYDELMSYLLKLDKISDRIQVKEVGKSSMGKPMYLAFISSAENLNKLNKLKEINRSLALDHTLNANELDQLIKEGKVFVYATLSMHSNEVGPTQAAPLIAYDMITTTDPEKLKWLGDVVFIMMPCHNPDGMDMIANYYHKTKNTRNEGASLPGVYHKYAGHNINRDFVTLSQPENKLAAAVYNTDWYPQVFVEKHQMGATGPRYFVPPNHDPIAENVDEGIWNWTRVFGANMMNDMTNEGLAGISSNYLFDNYWPGSTETCIWKNVVGMLTEAASVNIASPVNIESNELRVTGKGLSEYKKSINMPLPWPGGEWKLSDIIQYEISSTLSIMKTAYTFKEEILRFRNDLCRKQVEAGKNQPPYFYILPQDQHDKTELIRLINLLIEHGVRVYTLNQNITLGKVNYTRGDIVVPLSQPYRAFIKEVMEKQEYPVRRYTPNGEIIKPYDITSWSLPLHNGIECVEIKEPFPILYDNITEIKDGYNLFTDKEGAIAWVFDVNNNESFKAAFFALQKGLKVERLVQSVIYNELTLKPGSFVIYPGRKNVMDEFSAFLSLSPVFLRSKLNLKAEAVKAPSIALIETIFHDMDAGWTRYIFDSYYIPYTVFRPVDITTADLSKFDVIIFPDNDKNLLLSGKFKSGETLYMSNYDPSLVKGIEKEGLQKIMDFVYNGGKVVAWGRSCLLFEGILSISPEKDKKEEFQLPFRDLTPVLQKNNVYCPGSLINMTLIGDHPLTLGMQKEIGVFYRGSPAFSTSIPSLDMDRKVVGRIPESNILLSGYCENSEKLADTSLLIWLRKNKGQLVLMAFNPQFRASTSVSYKLLFNSLFL